MLSKPYQYERELLFKLRDNATEKEKLNLPHVPNIILAVSNYSSQEKSPGIKPTDELFKKVYLNQGTLKKFYFIIRIYSYQQKSKKKRQKMKTNKMLVCTQQKILGNE